MATWSNLPKNGATWTNQQKETGFSGYLWSSDTFPWQEALPWQFV